MLLEENYPVGSAGTTQELRSSIFDELEGNEKGEISEQQVVTLLRNYGLPKKVAA